MKCASHERRISHERIEARGALAVFSRIEYLRELQRPMKRTASAEFGAGEALEFGDVLFPPGLHVAGGDGAARVPTAVAGAVEFGGEEEIGGGAQAGEEGLGVAVEARFFHELRGGVAGRGFELAAEGGGLLDVAPEIGGVEERLGVVGGAQGEAFELAGVADAEEGVAALERVVEEGEGAARGPG